VVDDYFVLLSIFDQERLLVKRAERLKKVVNLLRETTRLRFAVQTDLTSAEAEAAQVAVEIAQIKGDQEAAAAALRTRLGLNATEPLTLDLRFGGGGSEAPDLKDWARWPDSTPYVIELKAKVSAASEEVSAAEWKVAPVLSVGATYSQPSFGYPDGSARALLGEVRVTLPIFDRGVRNVEKFRARRLRSLYENQLAARRVAVQNTISTLVAQRQANLRTLEHATRQKDLSERAFNGAWTLLSLGKRDYLTIRSTEEEVLLAERQWIETQRRLDAANARLRLFWEASRKAKSGPMLCRAGAED
jgi:outer membrane protein TolC